MDKTLENGVKVIIKETKGRGLVSGVIFFKGGVHGEEKRGETQLLFTMLLKGSKNYPNASAVSYPFEKYGGYIYSSSEDDFSEIGFSTKVEGLKEGLKVIRDIIQNPLFKEEVLELEKRNQIVAIRSKRERGMSYAYEELRTLTYKGTPYEYSSLGKDEDVERVSREDLIRRFNQIKKGENVVVVLVGDFKAEDVLPLLEEAFSDIPKGKFELSSVNKKIEKNEVKRVKREGTQATILCAFNAPPKDSKDYFVFKVYNAVLGEGMTSKLFKVLREEKGYAYATYSFYPTRYSSPRLFAYVGTSPEKKENALQDLIKVVSEGRVSEEDVELAKRKIIGDFLLDHQTRLRQAWYLGFFEVMGLGWKMDEEYTKRISEVKREEVEEAVRKYIDFHHCVVVEP
ncbi:M16 family metallopeptidase [Aquifex aeolicus]|nr:pitrilysin family protein [Aquifex aeolicus]